jgi:Ca2+-binding RTX toxin-like protein
MKLPMSYKLLVFGIFMMIWVGAVTAVAATNTVPSTRADEASAGIGTNAVKPYACSGLYLAGTISGSGTITGTAGNDLILGTSGADTIDGLGGNDCIVGGGGDDLIAGGEGTDICLGGGGSNTFLDCEG